MCGLVGFVTPSMSYSQGIQTISEMSSSLHHRGPDKSGYWHDSATNLFLSHTRLSILDTTLSGCQPMKSHCGRYSIVYNGEIYNHKELKNDILAKNSNHSFVGHSDTEVFLAYISIFGLNLALSRAIGMFAFALYDLNLQILFLCRDRFGEKPLYYGFQRQSLMFASELKAFRQHPDFEKKLSHKGGSLYFKYGYIPAPYSIYDHIYKIKPGTYQVFRLNSQTVSPDFQSEYTYWSPSVQASSTALSSLSFKESSHICMIFYDHLFPVNYLLMFQSVPFCLEVSIHLLLPL